jgi:hypothetical protein
MAIEYPGTAPTPAGAGHQPAVTSNPRVADVATAFARIRTVGDYMAVKDGGVFPRHRYTQKNQTINRSKVHFQGIQRHGDGQHLIMVGGDVVAPSSQLFVIRMDTRRKTGPWGSNIIKDGKAPDRDRLVHITALDGELWHPGGIDLCGDILVIPIETDVRNVSRVLFLDVGNPTSPILLKPQLNRMEQPIQRKATAVALCRLAQNDHFLCAILSGSGEERRIDLHLSESVDFEQGFSQHVEWPNAQLLPSGGRDFDFQSINFVVQKDGALFLVGSENKSSLAPLDQDDDLAELFSVIFPAETLRKPDPLLKMPAITRLTTKVFPAGHEYANMDAAGGAYVDRKGALSFYAGFHWRRKDEIHMSEYRPEVPLGAPKITQTSDAWIDVFEKRDFRGRRLSILGKAGTSFADYKKIRVQGKGFGDQVSSIRYQIPEDSTYRLFKESKFKDKGPDSVFDLTGTGEVIEIADLDQHDFEEVVSSSKYL